MLSPHERCPTVTTWLVEPSANTHAAAHAHTCWSNALIASACSLQSCKDKTGASVYSVMKYIVNKYPNLELDKRKYLLKKALQRQVEKGTIRQVRYRGLPPDPQHHPPVIPGFQL